MDNNAYQTPQSEVTTVDNEGTQRVRLFRATRIGRVRYIAYTVGFAMVSYIVAFLIALVLSYFIPANEVGSGMRVNMGGLLILALSYVLVIAATIWATIRRCHDFDVSGWLTLIIFVPLGVFVFWFAPGTDGENRFGLKPEPNKTIHWVGAMAGPLLVVLGILAAVAIPAYQDYVERAQQAQIQNNN